MCNDKEYEIFKAVTLIKMLIKRHEPKERALEVYQSSIYSEALKKLEELKC